MRGSSGRLGWWIAGLFLLLFIAALIAQAVAQRTATQLHRVDALRLPRVLQACEATAQAQEGSPVRFTLGSRDTWHVERQDNQMKWVLAGSFWNGKFNEVFYCEAVEEGPDFRVTSVESPAWWTPPPS